MKSRYGKAGQAERYLRYGIRKYSIGAASVLIAAGLAFLGGGAVQADQLAVGDRTAEEPGQGENQLPATAPVSSPVLASEASEGVQDQQAASGAATLPAEESAADQPSPSQVKEQTGGEKASAAEAASSDLTEPKPGQVEPVKDRSEEPAPAAQEERRVEAAAPEANRPKGTITIQNNNPDTGEFDIVVTDIVAPDGLRAVSLPTWSEANGQDDVQWYTAERQADGSYRRHVRALDHKNSLGEYNVHLYYVAETGELQGVTGIKTVVSKTRPKGTITIQNNNPDTGEFDIVVTDIVAPDGLRAVSLPTWSEANGQDDVQWYTAERQADGSYRRHVRALDHKNSLGEYNVHLYYVTETGELQGVTGIKTMVSKTRPKGTITIQNNNPDTGEFDIVVTDIVAPDGLRTVSLPTWSEANGQDDVQWYTAERQADGSYRRHVRALDHKNSLGEYNVHLYYVTEAGQLQGVTGIKTVVSKTRPKGTITIQNNNPDTGEFDIVVTDIVAPDGLRAVSLPTWSEANGQDDVQWYTAERQADGSYRRHVRALDHKNSLGEYNVHLYYVTETGQLQGVTGIKTVVSKTRPKGTITIQNNNPDTGEFDIVVTDIVAPDGLRAVSLPTWSEANGQDDVQWYTAERQADGSYRRHVRAADHKYTIGEYNVHLYFVAETGQLQGAGSQKVMVTVAPENIRPTGKINIQNTDNQKGSFEIVVTNVSNPGGVRAVYLPTWSSQNGQDDIQWYQAERLDNGNYRVQVKASHHKLSRGEYQIHLYYEQNDGSRIYVDATTTQVSKAAYQTPYYSQRDGRWAQRTYGGYNMNDTGCVPTTLAMVISGITGQQILPTAVADYLYHHTNEFNKGGYGTSSRGIVHAANHWGLRTEVLSAVSTIKDILSQGYHVLGAVGTSVFANYPITHELVLQGYDNGRTYVRDPYNAGNNGWYAVDYLFGVKSGDPTDNTEGSPFIAVKE